MILLITFNNIFCQKNSNSIFELSWKLDIPLCVTGLTVFTLPHLLPTEDVIYNPNEIRDLSNLNSFDRWSAQKYSKSVDITSDLFMYLSVLTPLSLLATEKSEYLTWTIMYFEAATLAYGVKDLLKYAVYKERPYMYFDGKPQKEIDENNYYCSFPSGHTTLAFLGATFTSYAFSKYFPESKWKVPVIIGSYTLATLSGTLRILSGSHFFSDVLVGATIGSAIGITIPFLHEFNSIINKKLDNKNVEKVNFSLLPNTLACTINY
ncbi:MAG: phosphatase PAP2 family protein [Treponemataceae bacterium]|nr:phosphatase PAP2 family protein [Treponemataceae bacterium]